MGNPYRDTQEDSEDEFSELDDLDDRLRDLDKAQSIWERIKFLQTMKMPCPECGGAGSIYGGSLSNTCPGCMGRRMVDHPAANEIKVPDFANMRRALSGAATARDQRLGLRAPGEMRLALPDPGRLPTRNDIAALIDEARKIAQGLPATPQIEGELREPPRAQLGDGEDESDLLGNAPDDRYLDELEEGADD
jgi:hypothetical protein